MNIEIGKINFYYVQEQFLRFLDYFMDKFVWAITETNPYLMKELRFIDNAIIVEINDNQNNDEVNQ